MNWGDTIIRAQTRGYVGKRLNLTKNRARMLNIIIERLSASIEEDDNGETYFSTLEWLSQQVQKRYSIFELCN